jgi:hypothetical protein
MGRGLGCKKMDWVGPRVQKLFSVDSCFYDTYWYVVVDGFMVWWISAQYFVRER